jgi:hypothetical protein
VGVWLGVAAVSSRSVCNERKGGAPRRGPSSAMAQEREREECGVVLRCAGCWEKKVSSNYILEDKKIFLVL